MPSSREIAQRAELRPIDEIAATAGLDPGEVEANLTVDDAIRAVTVEVTNAGSRAGHEVVQAYWRPDGDPVRLIGWAGVDVEPGQAVSVEVPIDGRVLRRWHRGGWQPLPLTGDVLIARGLGDIRVTLPVAGQR